MLLMDESASIERDHNDEIWTAFLRRSQALPAGSRVGLIRFADRAVVEIPWTAIEDTDFEIECDLIVSAIGQGGDLTGLEQLGNERHLIDADKFYQVPERPGHFVAGDIVRPHLLTTAIGQAAIAVDSIDHYLQHQELTKRPKVDVHHFDLLSKLNETGLAPVEYDHTQAWGTADAEFAIHNYEDRSAQEIIAADKLYLAHFQYTPRHTRDRARATVRAGHPGRWARARSAHRSDGTGDHTHRRDPRRAGARSRTPSRGASRDCPPPGHGRERSA